MASPVGHGLVGATVARAAGSGDGARDRGLYLLALFASVAPDLDYVPGILRGAPNLYHQSVSHSLGAALAFSLLVAGVTYLRRGAARRAWTMAWAGGLSYAAHLPVDLLGQPHGQPLLWPLSSDLVVGGWEVLPGVGHGDAGSGPWEFLEAVFSRENLVAVGLEILVLLPPCLAAAWALGRMEERARDGASGRDPG